jgi:hypothetical protein
MFEIVAAEAQKEAAVYLALRQPAAEEFQVAVPPVVLVLRAAALPAKEIRLAAMGTDQHIPEMFHSATGIDSRRNQKADPLNTPVS